jgi:hypothetical protein
VKGYKYKKYDIIVSSSIMIVEATFAGGNWALKLVKIQGPTPGLLFCCSCGFEVVIGGLRLVGNYMRIYWGALIISCSRESLNLLIRGDSKD